MVDITRYLDRLNLELNALFCSREFYNGYLRSCFGGINNVSSLLYCYILEDFFKELYKKSIDNDIDTPHISKIEIEYFYGKFSYDINIPHCSSFDCKFEIVKTQENIEPSDDSLLLVIDDEDFWKMIDNRTSFDNIYTDLRGTRFFSEIYIYNLIESFVFALKNSNLYFTNDIILNTINKELVLYFNNSIFSNENIKKVLASARIINTCNILKDTKNVFSDEERKYIKNVSNITDFENLNWFDFYFISDKIFSSIISEINQLSFAELYRLINFIEYEKAIRGKVNWEIVDLELDYLEYKYFFNLNCFDLDYDFDDYIFYDEVLYENEDGVKLYDKFHIGISILSKLGFHVPKDRK